MGDSVTSFSNPGGVPGFFSPGWSWVMLALIVKAPAPEAPLPENHKSMPAGVN
jgi:hypothetical protein